jgi:hypothetical protein
MVLLALLILVVLLALVWLVSAHLAITRSLGNSVITNHALLMSSALLELVYNQCVFLVLTLWMELTVMHLLALLTPTVNLNLALIKYVNHALIV